MVCSLRFVGWRTVESMARHRRGTRIIASEYLLQLLFVVEALRSLKETRDAPQRSLRRSSHGLT
jgi:hypothetical protein